MVRWVGSRRPRWCANTTEARHQPHPSSPRRKDPSMHDEPTGVRATLQSPERHCPACQQAKLCTEFSSTPAGLSSYCRDCQRAVSRLASRRRRAAMRLLIAAHPEEWAGLLVPQPEFVIFTVRWLAGGSGRHERGPAVGVSTTTSATSGRYQRPVRRRGRRTGAGSRCRSTG
jgi:hypothetical protein